MGEHLLDAVLDLTLAGNTGGVDVVDTGADVAGVLLVNEDAEQLGIGLGVLNGENIGVESGNGVEEVLELRVTEVRVDLSTVGDTGGGQLEGVDGPLEVGNALGASAEGKTLTESGLIDLEFQHDMTISNRHIAITTFCRGVLCWVYYFNIVWFTTCARYTTLLDRICIVKSSLLFL